jgi:hypothetical protein
VAAAGLLEPLKWCRIISPGNALNALVAGQQEGLLQWSQLNRRVPSQASLMDKNDRLAILDARDSDQFAAKYGESLDSELCDWIHLIVSAGASERSFQRLNALAWYIFVERQGVAFGEPVRFRVSSTVAAFQEFIYHLNLFSTMGIPYQEWHSMVAELFATLKQLAESGHFNFQSKECDTVEQDAAETLRRLTTDPDYAQRFTDLLNGAL